MSTPPPCIGPEFQIVATPNPNGKAVSQLNVKGPRSGTWPFAQARSSYNGFIRDSVSGMWVDPLGYTTSAGLRTTANVSTLLTQNTFNLGPSQPITINNSLCQPVQAIIWTSFRVAGTFVIGGLAQLRAYMGTNMTPDPNTMLQYRLARSQNQSGTLPPFTMNASVQTRFRIEAASSLTINRQMAIFPSEWVSGGSVTITMWEAESTATIFPKVDAAN